MPRERPLIVLSLGAWVQSSTLALMAAHGEVTPMPDHAIFADTQDEPASVYRWLDELEGWLPFLVHRVTRGRLSERALTMKVTKDGRRFSQTSIPVFTRNNDGSAGMVTHRNCTVDFKLDPIQKKTRELAHIKRGEKTVRVEQWIGISVDEAQRMKDSRVPWARNCYPLVERGITRSACLAWLGRHGYPQPPRSACVYCPFHSNGEWRRLQRDEPEAFAQAIVFERELQRVKANSDNFATTPYLHMSRQPLHMVDFSTLEDHGQQRLWGNECEGLCGV